MYVMDRYKISSLDRKIQPFNLVLSSEEGVNDRSISTNPAHPSRNSSNGSPSYLMKFGAVVVESRMAQAASFIVPNARPTVLGRITRKLRVIGIVDLVWRDLKQRKTSPKFGKPPKSTFPIGTRRTPAPPLLSSVHRPLFLGRWRVRAAGSDYIGDLAPDRRSRISIRLEKSHRVRTYPAICVRPHPFSLLMACIGILRCRHAK
jgi:hypothetical protein